MNKNQDLSEKGNNFQELVDSITPKLIESLKGYSLQKKNKKHLENLAYRTMGLEKKLRSLGLLSPAQELLKAHITALWTIEKWLAYPKIYGDPPTENEIKRAYKVMKHLSDHFSYDSGKIKHSK